MSIAVLGALVGLLIVMSAAAHGLLGWPALKETLDGAQVDAGVVGALGAGWYFGSVSMVGFGLIVLHQSLRRIRRQPVQPGPLWAVAIVYLTFGIGAYVLRDFKPHFLLFIATGALVALFGILGTRHGRRSSVGACACTRRVNLVRRPSRPLEQTRQTATRTVEG